MPQILSRETDKHSDGWLRGDKGSGVERHGIGETPKLVNGDDLQ